jgi:capsular exopolysaccharide synthesis family protein
MVHCSPVEDMAPSTYQGDDVRPAGYLWALRRNWRILVTGMLLGGLATALLLLTTTPVYVANIRFFVAASTSQSAADAYNGNLFSQQRVTSYAELITDQRFTETVVQELGLAMSPADLAEELEVTVIPNTVILAVSVTDPSPDRAFAIAQSVANQFNQVVPSLETPAGSSLSTVKIYTTAEPQRPTHPSGPGVPRYLVTGLLLGLLLTGGALLVMARLDTRIRDIEQAASALGAPPLGITPDDPRLAGSELLPASSRSLSAEALRQIRTSVELLDAEGSPKTLMVTSSVIREGKTTLAANLAVFLADAGRRVTLVEADLRRPGVAQLVGGNNDRGLSDILRGTASIEDVTQSLREESCLAIIPAGSTPPDPSKLLASPRMAALIADLRRRSDIVLIDAPALLPVADARALAPVADGVILCVRWGSTRREQVEESRRILDRVRARVVGVLLTQVPSSEPACAGLRHGHANRSDEEPMRSEAAEEAREAVPVPAAPVEGRAQFPPRHGPPHSATQRPPGSVAP